MYNFKHPPGMIVCACVRSYVLCRMETLSKLCTVHYNSNVGLFLTRYDLIMASINELPFVNKLKNYVPFLSSAAKI